MVRSISKTERFLEYILEPKHLSILIFILLAVNGILILFILIMSVNNNVLLHDFLIEHGLMTPNILRIDQINATNVTYMNYTN